MIIFPAIDIKDGVCVRLIKGDYRQITSYENTPIDQATKYFQNGFNNIHIVDIDGALRGKAVNSFIINEIVKKIKSKIQIGGGIRTIDDIKLSLPNDIVDLLNSYSCLLPTWEQAEFIFQEQDWGAEIVLTREELDEIVTGKLLKIENGTAFKVESFMIGNKP